MVLVDPVLACNTAQRWFVANGGHFDSRCYLDYSTTGIRVRASKDIHPDTVICSCPVTLTISYLNVLPSSHPDYKDSIRHIVSSLVTLVDSVPPHVISWFVLAEQFLQGGQSFWHPYLRTLPSAFDVLWLDDKFCLEGTNLWLAIDRRNAEWRSDINNALEVLLQNGIDVDKYTWELMRWAAQIYSSRSFTSKGLFPEQNVQGSLLFPVVDYLNHDHYAKVLWKFDEKPFTITSPQPLKQWQGIFNITNKEMIKQGHEIFNNYGPKSNEELLLGYGFCILNNPYDELLVRPSAPSPSFLQDFSTRYDTDITSPNLSFAIRHASHGLGDYRRPGYPKVLNPFPPLLIKALIELHHYSSSRTCSPIDFASQNHARNVLQAYRRLVALLRPRLEAMKASMVRLKTMTLTYPDTPCQAPAAIYQGAQFLITCAVIRGWEYILKSLLATHRPNLDLRGTSALIDFSTLCSAVSHALPELYASFLSGIAAILPEHESTSAIQASDDADIAFIVLLGLLHSTSPASLGAGAPLPYLWLADLRNAYPDPVPASEVAKHTEYSEALVAIATQVGGLWTEALVNDIVWASWVFAHEHLNLGARPGRDVIYVRAIEDRKEVEEDWLMVEQEGPALEHMERQIEKFLEDERRSDQGP